MCESEYDGRMHAATRNIESLFTAINHFEKMRVEDAARVIAMQETLTLQQVQIGNLIQQVAVLQAKLYEAGVR